VNATESDRLSDFQFELPEGLIATKPAEPRDSARLLALEKGGTRHLAFRDLPSLLKRGDSLVLNETKVVPARLWAKRPTGGRVELLVLDETRALARNARSGDRLALDGGASAELGERDADGAFEVRFGVEDVRSYLAAHGETPLPPYIAKRRAGPPTEEDRQRYQTVYARSEGSVAAPTAGLHFTPELLARLEREGVRIERLTCHIGWGTFRPVESEDLSAHRMLAESYEIAPAVAERLIETKRSGGRVVAVGTSATRSLETAAASGWKELSGASDLFIRPGHRFLALDALVTNFHIPGSTPLLLACAFAGRERLLAAYAEAIERGYRFYSYGDSTFLG
jgi:S-adenosylmethionine:tRNA ribosyltransferase-isomerase